MPPKVLDRNGQIMSMYLPPSTIPAGQAERALNTNVGRLQTKISFQKFLLIILLFCTKHKFKHPIIITSFFRENKLYGINVEVYICIHTFFSFEMDISSTHKLYEQHVYLLFIHIEHVDNLFTF